MADYTKLKTAIRQVIKQNGNNEITGDLLQQTLLSIVNTVGAGRVYMGMVRPHITPIIQDANVFYIAALPGIYTGFSNKEVKKGTIGIFTNEGNTWTLSSINLSNFGVQMTEDAALQTEDKTVVGAINEVVNETGLDSYPEFSAAKPYVAGDVVRYSGKLYRFTVAHPAGAWIGTDAEQTSVKEELDRAVAMKANVDGYYETMRVGTADNLTPRGDASEEIIMNRTAGGDNVIESGDALVKSIKGNSVVRNQYIRDHKFETLPSGSIWNDYGGDTQVSNGELTSTVTKEYSGITQNISVIKGHKYLFIIQAKSPDRIRLFVPYLWIEYFPENTSAMVTQEFKTYVSIQTASLTGSDSSVGVRAGSGVEMGTSFTVKNLSMFDLTQMFGAGNEPSTQEEFAHRLGYDNIEQLPYIPYNEGEIVSCNAEGIRTTDAEGDTYERKWTSTLQKYFPDGLKSAGTIYDEITPTKAVKRIGSVDLGEFNWEKLIYDRYITTVPIQDMKKAEPDSISNILTIRYKPSIKSIVEQEDMQIATDGQYIIISNRSANDIETLKASLQGAICYYELATPEEYTYDELNLTERVAPGGIEEAIVSEGVLSTPLKIDVVYPIDAYGTIVNNRRHIGNLSSLQTQAKDDLVSAINENNQLAKDAYPTGGYLAELYKAGGAVYNEKKGLWVLNDIELTDEEMAEVYSFGNLSNSNGSNWSNRLVGYRGKTTIPYNGQLGLLLNSSLNLDGAFALCKNLEILSISTINTVFPESVNFLLYDSPKLRIVENIIKMSYCKEADRFAYKATSLESIKLKGVLISLSFSDSPLLTVEDTEKSTLGFLVANAENTAPITVTLHADAYARVPESLKTKAQEKQISIVSA